MGIRGNVLLKKTGIGPSYRHADLHHQADKNGKKWPWLRRECDMESSENYHWPGTWWSCAMTTLLNKRQQRVVQDCVIVMHFAACQRCTENVGTDACLNNLHIDPNTTQWVDCHRARAFDRWGNCDWGAKNRFLAYRQIWKVGAVTLNWPHKPNFGWTFLSAGLEA